MVRVLVVDDEETPRSLLAAELDAAGFAVSEAGSGEEGLRVFEEFEPDIVVTDKNMPRGDGLELLSQIRDRSPVPVIVLTAYGTVASAVNAMKAGASDYLSSDDVELSELVDVVRAASSRGLRTQNNAIEEAFPGRSEVANRLRRKLEVFSPLEKPVLFRGPSGSDPARLARAVHLVGASPGSALLEVEGGRFSRDTLDEAVTGLYIASPEDLSAESQEFLAERIREREAPRIFASTEATFDSSSLSAELVSQLEQLVIEVPLLRDHTEDVPEIAASFLDSIARQLERPGIRLTEEAAARLTQHRWPGNEDELWEVLQYAAVMSPGRAIERVTIELAIDESIASVSRIRKMKSSLERDQLIAALRESDGVVTHAAQILGVNRSAIYRMMDKHGLERERKR